VLICYTNKASTLYEFGRLEEAVLLLKKVMPLADLIGGELQQTVYYNLAFMLHDQGKIQEAKQWALKTLTLREAIFPPDHVDILRTKYVLGSLLVESNQLEEAELYFQQIIQATKDKQPVNTRYLRALVQLAWIRLEQNQPKAAEKYIAQVKKTQPTEDTAPKVVLELQALEGVQLAQKGQRSEGKAMFKEALRKLTATEPKDLALERMLKKWLNKIP